MISTVFRYTTIKIIFMNITPINIIIHIQSITPNFSVSLGLYKWVSHSMHYWDQGSRTAATIGIQIGVGRYKIFRV